MSERIERVRRSSRAHGEPREAVPTASTTRQARERLGGHDRLLAALEAGSLVRLWPGVVVPADSVHDPATRAEAALLRAGAGAVLSGPTALAMHGCRAAGSRIVHVTVPYHRQLRREPGLVVRQGRVREREVVELDGLRAQVLDVALTEVLCTAEEQLAVACLRQATALPDVELGRGLRAMVEQRLARRSDRRGTRRARSLLEAVSAPGPTSLPA
ncbi:hypothetical protein FHR84_002666 [Actinopolyspora biskrensis]|uniref:Transcriptional regulator, AbiEi antitoxin, Type IV TA system n=1 Tax=Actinopolyspora biskrensis TaxID=1470178 RepID=A0A852Z009_9ACTN|nr:hypothetical protein [Actinopolyspora biskrensis]NYH79332.1 hypothetical protein [Actinopolyspora biskrensis]